MACVSGAVSDTCDPLAGAAAADATCDNVNDDCDGATDENYVSTASSCGVGACLGNTGTLSCSIGVESDSCNPVAGASAENTSTVGSCTDTVDNDCDGSTDAADVSCGAASTPPVALFSVSPGAGDTATNFAGDATTSFDLEDAFASLTIDWDWDGDGSFEQTGATSNHIYATPGVHRVTIRVTDTTALADYRVFDVVVASPGDLLIVTTGADESDGGATPGSPGGTGFSLREAIAFAVTQGTRKSILVPSGTAIPIGTVLTLSGLTSGVDIVGDGATIDGSGTALDCLEINNTTSVRVFGLAITNCPGFALSILNGSHTVERCDLSSSLMGASIESNGGTFGPHNLVSACGTGVELTGVTTVLENRMTGSAGAGIFLRAGSQGSLVQGNEFLRNDVGIEAISTNNSDLYHNTIHDSATASIRLSNSVSSYGLLNNIFSTAPIALDARTGNFATRETNDYFNVTTECVSCTLVASERTDDPLYIDDASDDYRLQSSSLLIGTGTDTALDINGAAPGNFNGAAPDMGANEAP
jgi:parallel beta-helix repeat protein